MRCPVMRDGGSLRSVYRVSEPSLLPPSASVPLTSPTYQPTAALPPPSPHIPPILSPLTPHSSSPASTDFTTTHYSTFLTPPSTHRLPLAFASHHPTPLTHPPRLSLAVTAPSLPPPSRLPLPLSDATLPPRDAIVEYLTPSPCPSHPLPRACRHRAPKRHSHPRIRLQNTETRRGVRFLATFDEKAPQLPVVAPLPLELSVL